MTTDNLKHKPGNWQENHPKLFERIANLDIAFIKTKMEIERTQRKLRRLEEALEQEETINVMEEETSSTYDFDKNEMLALDNLHEASSELLVVTEGITKRLATHLTLEEAKEILTLRNDIMRVYNNYNFHLQTVKSFEAWLKKQLQKHNEPLIIKEEK